MMPVEHSKPKYPFLMGERGRKLIERELRNEYTIADVPGFEGKTHIVEIKRGHLGLDWMLEQSKELKAILDTTVSEPRTLKAGETITVGEMFGRPVGSPAWHATNIQFWMEALVRVLRSNQEVLSNEDMDEIVNAGVRLGAAIKESLLAEQFSDPLLSGLKRGETLRNSSARANAKRQADASALHSQWREAATEIWARKPGLTIQACAKAVISRLGLETSVKIRTVRDRIRSVKPTKKVGEAG
jgi:hypothetical protein